MTIQDEIKKAGLLEQADLIDRGFDICKRCGSEVPYDKGMATASQCGFWCFECMSKD